jgi:hypothetical protein
MGSERVVHALPFSIHGHFLLRSAWKANLLYVWFRLGSGQRNLRLDWAGGRYKGVRSNEYANRNPTPSAVFRK